MNPLPLILVVAWLAGLSAFLGGVAARFENSAESAGKREVIHGVVAFGGGILIAAVAFALAPEGIKNLSTPLLIATFCGGGLLFCLLDAWLSHTGGTASQFIAMLVDFVPEALSMGAVFSQNQQLGVLLAIFIGIQNLPEGFNAFREIVTIGARPRNALLALFAVSFLGPLAAWIGHSLLRGQTTLTSGIMTFAGGGILYLVFQDIAPQARMKHHWAPTLGAVFGFLVGMLGKQLLG